MMNHLDYLLPCSDEGMAAHIHYSMGLSYSDLVGYWRDSNAGEAAFLGGLCGNLDGIILRVVAAKYSVGVTDILLCHQIHFYFTIKIWHLLEPRILLAFFKVEPIILKVQLFYCFIGTIALSSVVLD